jgi:hypothetical protein
VWHAKLPKHTKKWPREAAKVPEQWTLARSECRVLASGTLPVLLDHATLLLLRAEMAGRAAANSPPRRWGSFAGEQWKFVVPPLSGAGVRPQFFGGLAPDPIVGD